MDSFEADERLVFSRLVTRLRETLHQVRVTTH